MLHKGEKQEIDASVTVEAVFVMPVVLLTVFALIYLAFYLHDRCRIQGIVDQTLHNASVSLKHETDPETGRADYDRIGDRGVYYLLLGDRSESETKFQSYLGKELSGGLWLTRVTRIQADMHRTELEITVGTKTEIAIPWINSFFASFSKDEIRGEATIHDPAETIRICEVVLDTGAQIKGVGKLMEKIDEILGK